MRGLKVLVGHGTVADVVSHPTRDAWIKGMLLTPSSRARRPHSSRDALIKSSTTSDKGRAAQSHPTRDAWQI